MSTSLSKSYRPFAIDLNSTFKIGISAGGKKLRSTLLPKNYTTCKRWVTLLSAPKFCVLFNSQLLKRYCLDLLGFYIGT